MPHVRSRTRLLDNDGDGVYEATIDLPKMEVKESNGKAYTTRWRVATPRWAQQEPWSEGFNGLGGAPLVSSYMLNWDDSCLVGPIPDPDKYWNRFVPAGECSGGKLVLPIVCWDSCGPCPPSPPTPLPPSTPPLPPPTPPAPPAPPVVSESGGKAVAEPAAAAVTAGAAIGTVAVAAALAAVAAAAGAVATAADAAVASVAAAGDAAVAAATAGAADVARQADVAAGAALCAERRGQIGLHRKLPSRRAWRS